MSILRVPLSAIPESGFRIDAAVERARLRPAGAEDLAVVEVRLKGAMYRVGEDYFFKGTVAGRFDHECDRCLEAVSVRLETAVSWTFRLHAPQETVPEVLDSESLDEEELLYGFEGSDIDLAPRVWEELVLLAPVKFLCRAGCAGLCPHCGANLNRDTCACPKEEPIGNTGLAGLNKVYFDLKRQPPKE